MAVGALQLSAVEADSGELCGGEHQGSNEEYHRGGMLHTKVARYAF